MYYPPVRQSYHTKPRNMTVYGSGFVSVEPNVARIQLGVVTQDVELETAQQENARIIDNVIQSLQRLSIDQDHIQTADYTIFPQYDYIDGSQKFKGYEVTHLLSITLDNIEQTGKVIDTAVQSGVNKITTITFNVKDREVFYQQALKMAVENATNKAQVIAGTMRVNLDPVPNKLIEQLKEQILQPYQQLASAEVGGVSTPIEPGLIEIEARVEAEFNYFS
ncbi:SIMPL domain-containing protein [Radiobacillus sp. PE A8.2]|uniref:SIMPL domain-containing protein n=1 Tax=Radiobacillus sp. PE A8.2 TaxID=3380349 RepID=UPI00388FCA07